VDKAKVCIDCLVCRAKQTASGKKVEDAASGRYTRYECQECGAAWYAEPNAKPNEAPHLS